MERVDLSSLGFGLFEKPFNLVADKW